MLRSVKTFEIRKAGPQDAGLLSVLAAATFYEAYFEQDDPHDLAEYIINSFEPALMTEQISAPDSVFFIAFADGRAVGYAKLIDNSREPCIRASNTIELKRIYIVERIWRNGMGESLFKALHRNRQADGQRFDMAWGLAIKFPCSSLLSKAWIR